MSSERFLVRDGSEIVAVRVTDMLTLPLEHLMLPVEYNNEPYWRHLRGGGLVADTSYAPDTVTIPSGVVVKPELEVESYEVYAHGTLSQAVLMTHDISKEAKKLRIEQHEMGIVGRLLSIERSLTLAAQRADTLF